MLTSNLVKLTAFGFKWYEFNYNSRLIKYYDHWYKQKQSKQA